jgi:hypothetical protein
MLAISSTPLIVWQRDNARAIAWQATTMLAGVPLTWTRISDRVPVVSTWDNHATVGSIKKRTTYRHSSVVLFFEKKLAAR